MTTETPIPLRLRSLLTTPALRAIGLLALLGLEGLLLTLHFDTQQLTGAAPAWAAWLGYAPAGIRIGLASVAAFLVLVRPRLPTLWQALRTYARRPHWGLWVVGHGVACGVFSWVTAALLAVETAAVPASLLWPVGWGLSGATMVLLWLGALAPPRVWWHLGQQEYRAVLGASLVGVGAWGSGQLAQALWAPLAALTSRVVCTLLGVVYTDLHFDLATQVVGTATFAVTIDAACAGYEGIGCITLLLLLYLWLFRTHLRFPQAWVLLPVGVLASWGANVLRLTALIALGSSVSPAIAQGGFHSQAGWIAFLLVGFGVMLSAQRCPFVTGAPVAPPPASPAPAPYATAHLAPLLVLLATLLVTAAVSNGVDYLYPVRVVTTGVALWAFRTGYRPRAWTWRWHPLILGVVVFGVWMVLAPAAHHEATLLAERLPLLPGALTGAWVAFRVLGAVLTVPLAEELAFRGYVLPKLSTRACPPVRPGQYTWGACLGSAVLFGVVHGAWLAGTLAGLGYALALRQRGQLADAIVAHMTTNALLAGYVLSQHTWALWGV